MKSIVLQSETDRHLSVATLPPPNYFNPLKAELNPICHLLALLLAHSIFHVSRIRVKIICEKEPIRCKTVFSLICFNYIGTQP
jgi:transposase